MPHKNRSHSKNTSILESLFEDSSHWVNNVCTLSMGDWACKTALKMIEQVLDFDRRYDYIGPDYESVIERLGIRKAGP